MAQSLDHKDYTVGWISARTWELKAAIHFLGKPHSRLSKREGDPNIYELGCIGQHNVVMACLPARTTGKGVAATVATHMLSTFPSIEFGLMVGIGGGVPSKEHDIRLGDVVVSQPTGMLGGVVQYDFGKTMPEGQSRRTGSSNKPPAILLNTVSNLKARLGEESKLVSFNPVCSKFNHPRAHDVLFKPEYGHVGTSDECLQCDTTQHINRPTRSSEPRIHYGVIASGDQVMKDGAIRDRLGREYGALCFEMEAAGLMDSFPCLVIRGISDYADSHKNKRWQRYAAAAAAAYAKEILDIIPQTKVAGTTSATRTTDEAMPVRPLNSAVPQQTSNVGGSINTGGGKSNVGNFHSAGNMNL